MFFNHYARTTLTLLSVELCQSWRRCHDWEFSVEPRRDGVANATDADAAVVEPLDSCNSMIIRDWLMLRNIHALHLYVYGRVSASPALSLYCQPPCPPCPRTAWVCLLFVNLAAKLRKELRFSLMWSLPWMKACRMYHFQQCFSSSFFLNRWCCRRARQKWLRKDDIPQVPCPSESIHWENSVWGKVTYSPMTCIWILPDNHPSSMMTERQSHMVWIPLVIIWPCL